MRWAGCLLFVSCCVLGHGTLAGDEAVPADDEAFLKAAGVATDSPSLLEFFRKRTLTDADCERLRGLIARLGDDSFEVREKASAKLVQEGARAARFLREAQADADAEIVRRAEDCLQLIKEGPGVALAAGRLLALRRPKQAASVLLGYLPFAENVVVADAIRHNLAQLANPHGKADPDIVAALDDKNAVRRGAAAEALLRAGASDQQERVARLLHDPDPLARFRAALPLAEGRLPRAVPVLVDLVEQLPPEPASLIEDFLFRLAGDSAPLVGLGVTPASRHQFRLAWTQWWNERGSRLDLAKALATPKTRGYTLLLLLDVGRALEIDDKGKPRWEFEGLQFPLDIQLISRETDHVLVAEHNGDCVTERDTQGAVVWKKEIKAPLMAQRLPDGHTFIATAEYFVEVDRSGREIYSLQPPSVGIMKAQKLRNGEILCLLQGGKVARLDAAGRVLQSFSINVRYSGGRIEVLPNGHLLIPLTDDNKVAEFDALGKIVWEYEVEKPIAATRLADDNILVTSMDQSNYRALELDRVGRVVWEYRPIPNTRVNRAYRR